MKTPTSLALTYWYMHVGKLQLQRKPNSFGILLCASGPFSNFACVFVCLLSFFEQQMYGPILFLNSLKSKVNERGENQCFLNPINER